MSNVRRLFHLTCLGLAVAGWGSLLRAEETVATAVYGRVAKSYKREPSPAGGYKPEFYALANGGRIDGTGSDLTVDRVSYAEVATVAMRLLVRQNYHYAQSKDQAKLLIVLQWGSTIAPDSLNYEQSVNRVGAILAASGPQGMGSLDKGMQGVGGDSGAEGELIHLMMENRARHKINEANARVLGYLDDLNDSNDIRRWAGGGDRYDDLIGDVEETRYFIVISAYDFPELVNHEKRKLLWQTRVSVRAPGNRFDDSFAAMLKGASKYFGQDSGRLIRGEESKGTVEVGDLKFLGEAKERD